MGVRLAGRWKRLPPKASSAYHRTNLLGMVCFLPLEFLPGHHAQGHWKWMAPKPFDVFRRPSQPRSHYDAGDSIRLTASVFEALVDLAAWIPGRSIDIHAGGNIASALLQDFLEAGPPRLTTDKFRHQWLSEGNSWSNWSDSSRGIERKRLE